jgi:ABC-type transport system involved in multi-copper enzyme maturation permease subunit
MRSLLQADFKRVFKDKLLLVLGILAVAFALMTPVLYAVLFSAMGVEQEPMLAGLISAKAQFFSSFSMGNNLGLIVPVLLGIVLCKDFSYGTVRNKIIAGKSRTAIFLSLFCTCAVVLCAVMLVHAFLTLGVSLLFFDYQPTAFTGEDLLYFLVSLGFELLVLLWMAALLSWLWASAKNAGIAIVLYIAVTFALVIVGSIIQMAYSFAAASQQELSDLLYFLDRINVGTAVSYIGMGTEYALEDVLYLTIPALLGIFGFTGLGIATFRKKDLK